MSPMSGSQSREFVQRKLFIANAFQQRYQPFLQSALLHHRWHIIGAVPGSGKSEGIADLIRGSGMFKDRWGLTYMPILALRAPKNVGSENALGIAMAASFGVVPRMPWEMRRTWLVGEANRVGVKLIIVDDAQDLSMAQLAYLKEFIDNLTAAPYESEVGLCLVCACENGTIQLTEIISHRTELIWRQFKRRLDPETGNVIIPNHNVKELRDILRCYEDVYRDQLPELGLQQWARAIHGYLTHDLLDPERSQLVTMDNIHKYLMIVLRRSVEAGMADVYPTILLDAAQRMVHGIDTVVNLEDETAELDD